jgi:hypothetical protein
MKLDFDYPLAWWKSSFTTTAGCSFTTTAGVRGIACSPSVVPLIAVASWAFAGVSRCRPGSNCVYTFDHIVSDLG